MSNGSPISRLLIGRLETLGKDSAWLRAELSARGEDLSGETIRNWLNGGYAPHPKKYPAVADVLGIRVASLALAAAGLDDSDAAPAAESP